jgi:outer membrane protein TolC
MIRKFLTPLALAGLVSVCSALAEEVTPSDVHYVSYDEAVQIALHDNVDLLALRNQEESLKYQSKQAIAPNEPVFSYVRNDTPSFSLTQQSAQTVYQINWTLGFPGKALANSTAIHHQAEATAQQALTQEITIMTSLSNSYVAFATNAAFYKFLLEEQRSDKELKKLIEKKFAASQASKVDLLNAEVATQLISQSILENRNEYDVQLTLFRQIIRRPSDLALMPKIPDKIVIPPVRQSFDELVPIMLKNNHAVAAASKNMEGQSALLANSMLQALPDFQLMAALNEWIPAGAPNGPNVLRDYSVGVGIAIPIFFPFNELQGVHAARENLGVAENQFSSQQLQAVAALQTAYTSLKATLKELETSEKLVVPAAKSSFDLTLLTYGLGKADYFIVNQSRQAWHEASRDMLTKRQTAAQLYNTLINQMGCDITKTEGPNVCK